MKCKKDGGWWNVEALNTLESLGKIHSKSTHATRKMNDAVNDAVNGSVSLLQVL